MLRESDWAQAVLMLIFSSQMGFTRVDMQAAFPSNLRTSLLPPHISLHCCVS